MGARPPSSQRAYEITCAGIVPAAGRAELDAWAVDGDDATTRLSSRRPVDQAALHGTLDRLASLGLTVLTLRQLPEVRDQTARDR